ncbi:transcriptional regulator [Enterobacter quasiroggenkampii]
MNYILSGKLLYSAEDGRIVLLGEPHVEVVVLSPIPNRILMVLIENQGEIVSRDDFFVKVWDQHGKTGSANTLKQYIGLIRRILDSHLDENCIITVPGKGYSFSSVVDITTDAGEICEPHQIGIDEITSVKKTYSCRILKRLTCTILKKKVYVFSSVFFFLLWRQKC